MVIATIPKIIADIVIFITNILAIPILLLIYFKYLKNNWKFQNQFFIISLNKNSFFVVVF